jgi:hypothetical protein
MAKSAASIPAASTKHLELLKKLVFLQEVSFPPLSHLRRKHQQAVAIDVRPVGGAERPPTDCRFPQV